MMFVFRDRTAAPRRVGSSFFIAVICLPFAAPTSAQSAPAASAPAAAISPTERAQRDADNVFRWILIHSDKPRKAAPPAKDDKPAPVARSKPAPRVPAAGANEAVAAPAAAAVAPPALVVVPAPARAEVARIEAAPAPAPAALPPAAAVATAAPTVSPEPAKVVATAAEATTDQSLVPLLQVDPRLPTNLPRGARNGEVQVRFMVLPDGSVAEAKVASSSNPRLNTAALAAVAQWRFAPLRRPQPGSVALVFNVE